MLTRAVAPDAAVAEPRSGLEMEPLCTIIQISAAGPDDLGDDLLTVGLINEALELAYQKCLSAY